MNKNGTFSFNEQVKSKKKISTKVYNIPVVRIDINNFQEISKYQKKGFNFSGLA